MKKIISFYLVFYSLYISAQIKFSVEYEADYKLTYKSQNTTNSPIKESAFALLIGKNESYFKNMNKYVGDSLIVEKKLKETNDPIKNIKSFGPYHTEFPENIGITRAKIYVSLSISDKQFKYEEDNNINWKIINEFKKIGTMNCQRAETYKYGRKWIAYFNEEIPFPYGPYKFSNLPGLIIEVFDEKKDYVYTLYKFGKRKYVCNSANLYTKAKTTTKAKIFDYKRNSMSNPERFNSIIDDPEVLKTLRERSVQMAKIYNPIELEVD